MIRLKLYNISWKYVSEFYISMLKSFPNLIYKTLLHNDWNFWYLSIALTALEIFWQNWMLLIKIQTSSQILLLKLSIKHYFWKSSYGICFSQLFVYGYYVIELMKSIKFFPSTFHNYLMLRLYQTWNFIMPF